MRKKFSFLSGLAAVILFLFTFSNGTYAADTAPSGPDTSGTVQGTTYLDVQNTTYTDVPNTSASDVPSSDVTGSTYDVTGSTYDVTGSAYDVTGSTYDVTGSTYDVTGSTYDVTGSTYDVGGATYQDVYQDVYYDYADITNTTPTSNGDVVFDYSNNSQSGLSLNTYLTSDDVGKLSHFVAKSGNVEVSYPTRILPTDQQLTLSILPLNQELANSLSPVYDFSIEAYDYKTGNSSFVKEFSQNPVLLTFKFDPKKLENANDDVTVKYIGDDGRAQPEIVSVDKVKGVIVAKVFHFSNYGVFEVPNSSTSTGSTSGTTTTGKTTGTTTATPTTSSTTTTAAAPTTSGTTTTVAAPTTGGTTTTAAAPTTGSSTTTKTAASNALPNTATDNYNFLIVGLILVALGGVLFTMRNRKSTN